MAYDMSLHTFERLFNTTAHTRTHVLLTPRGEFVNLAAKMLDALSKTNAPRGLRASGGLQRPDPCLRPPPEAASANQPFGPRWPALSVSFPAQARHRCLCPFAGVQRRARAGREACARAAHRGSGCADRLRQRHGQLPGALLCTSCTKHHPLRATSPPPHPPHSALSPSTP